MEFQWYLWIYLDFLQYSNDFPWMLNEFHGSKMQCQWLGTKFFGFCQIFMGFQRFSMAHQWLSMESEWLNVRFGSGTRFLQVAWNGFSDLARGSGHFANGTAIGDWALQRIAWISMLWTTGYHPCCIKVTKNKICLKVFQVSFWRHLHSAKSLKAKMCKSPRPYCNSGAKCCPNHDFWQPKWNRTRPIQPIQPTTLTVAPRPAFFFLHFGQKWASRRGDSSKIEISI